MTKYRSKVRNNKNDITAAFCSLQNHFSEVLLNLLENLLSCTESH